MRDAISREQAIEIVQNRCKRYATACVLAVTEIKQLPPIQPASSSEFPNNSDTISRRAAIDALENDKAALDKIIKGMSAMDVRLDAYVSQRNQVVYDIDAIEHFPPAEPKRGRWIRTGSGSLFDHYECSECGKAPKWECMGNNRWKIAFTDFCPNCGAKMEVNHESN